MEICDPNSTHLTVSNIDSISFWSSTWDMEVCLDVERKDEMQIEKWEVQQGKMQQSSPTPSFAGFANALYSFSPVDTVFSFGKNDLMDI